MQTLYLASEADMAPARIPFICQRITGSSTLMVIFFPMPIFSPVK